MPAFPSFQVAMLPQVQTAIITPVSRTYGSLELSKLERLGIDLADFSSESAAEIVVIDLSGVQQHGSGFLSELIAFADDLRLRQIELFVSGDQTGLVQLVGGSAWCQVTADLVDALNHCGRMLVAS